MTDLVLDASQERAVELVRTARIGIVTGGPGTGKSTCLRVALEHFDRNGVVYALASPTGKAAKRLSEATEGRFAQTLHRLLEYNPGKGGFQRHQDNPLQADVVIVDESSMVDTCLFAALLRAVAEHRTRLILVGDADQLPPVGPGRPFSDLVAWGQLPTVRLQVLHRTALTSWIHTAAQDLLHDREPALEPRADFRFVEVNDPKWILPKVRTVVTEWFGPGKHIDAEPQVLIPQRPGIAGIDLANPMLQAALNPRPAGERMWPRGDWHIRVGDLVIQTRNDYDLGIFNGEIGRVTAIGRLRDIAPADAFMAATNQSADGLIVDYPGHFVVGDQPPPPRRTLYTSDKIYALQLAYALTIHRTQGSEFPWAIVVCHSTHSYMLARQLLYTAITRAKAGVVLVGDRKGLARAVANRRPEVRNTTLIERLEDTLEPAEEFHPSQLEDFNAESPTIH